MAASKRSLLTPPKHTTNILPLETLAAPTKAIDLPSATVGEVLRQLPAFMS